jgi:hypothetical protein
LILDINRKAFLILDNLRMHCNRHVHRRVLPLPRHHSHLTARALAEGRAPTLALMALGHRHIGALVGSKIIGHNSSARLGSPAKIPLAMVASATSCRLSMKNA